jgi:hypothetical protein
VLVGKKPNVWYDGKAVLALATGFGELKSQLAFRPDLFQISAPKGV